MLISWWNVTLLVNMILHGCFFWIAYIYSKTLRSYEKLQCGKQFISCLLLAFSFTFRQLYVWHSTTCLFCTSIASFTAVSVEILIADFKVKFLLLKAAFLSAHYHAEWATNLFGYHSSQQQTGRIQLLTLALLCWLQYTHFLTEISWEKQQGIMNNML